MKWYLVAWPLWLSLAAVVVVLAQDKPPAPPKYGPHEVQSLRLQLKHKDAELAQIALQTAQAAFQRAMSDLTEEGKRVKTENKWPEDVQFSPNDMSFSEPAPPPAKPEEKKP